MIEKRSLRKKSFQKSTKHEKNSILVFFQNSKKSAISVKDLFVFFSNVHAQRVPPCSFTMRAISDCATPGLLLYASSKRTTHAHMAAVATILPPCVRRMRVLLIARLAFDLVPLAPEEEDTIRVEFKCCYSGRHYARPPAMGR